MSGMMSGPCGPHPSMKLPPNALFYLLRLTVNKWDGQDPITLAMAAMAYPSTTHGPFHTSHLAKRSLPLSESGKGMPCQVWTECAIVLFISSDV